MGFCLNKVDLIVRELKSEIFEDFTQKSKLVGGGIKSLVLKILEFIRLSRENSDFKKNNWVSGYLKVKWKNL